MESIVIVFLIGFCKIAARAFQQKNVMTDQFLSIIPISYIMGFLEISMIGISAIEIMNEGWMNAIPLVFFYSTGGWMGCWFAIWLHRKIHTKRDNHTC